MTARPKAPAPRAGKGPGTRRLTADVLHVAPSLVGQPLASPGRRLLALVLDYLILLLPTLAVAVAAAYVSLLVTDPAAVKALWALQRADAQVAPETVRQAWKDLAPLLVRLEAPGLPPRAADAVERGDLDAAAQALMDRHLLIALAIGEHEELKHQAETVTFRVERVIPGPLRWLSLFGVAALYFTWLTARWGRTLGKRLAGIRVAHLGGERLSLLESFERFAGYLEIAGTLGLALLSLWRDPNRRMPHDRVAHTVVLREERRKAPSVKPRGRPR
ncbi:MAG: RDD family protein [Acidobacteriota bacterium]